MVDTIPFSQEEPPLRVDLIVKIVLGAINSVIDHGKVPPSVHHYQECGYYQRVMNVEE
jgi:hypothetical protein